jgi:hypothetical protein
MQTSTTPRRAALYVRVSTTRKVGIIRSPVRAIALPDSVDGPGQHNPDRSEGPWGRAAGPLARRCL